MSHTTTPAPPGAPDGRPRRVNRILLALTMTGALAVGGAGVAYAANTTTQTTSSSTSGSSSSSGSSDSTGSSSSSATTNPGTPGAPRHGRTGGPGADGPGAGGPAAGGPAAGGPGAGGPAADGPAGRGPGGPGHGPAKSASDIDGRLSAVDGSSLTVTDEFGQTRTYALGSTTTIHQGPRQQLSASDLHVGDHVHVRGQAASTSGGALQAVDVDVHLAHIDGVVTAVDGGSLTVTDRDGFTRQITTSSDTTYRTGPPTKVGTGSTNASSIHTGTVVHAEGRVDSNGTALDATSIEIRTAPTGTADGIADRPAPPASPSDGGASPQQSNGPSDSQSGSPSTNPSDSPSGDPSLPVSGS